MRKQQGISVRKLILIFIVVGGGGGVFSSTAEGGDTDRARVADCGADARESNVQAGTEFRSADERL